MALSKADAVWERGSMEGFVGLEVLGSDFLGPDLLGRDGLVVDILLGGLSIVLR
jgi:hypothetical protein